MINFKRFDFRLIKILVLLFTISLLIGCTKPQNNQVANPASVHCEEQGYNLEIRTDPDGSQYGVCIFPDGSECEEWAYYRGECKPE